MKLNQYNEHIISIMSTDGLVLERQGISSHSAEYVSNNFQLFMGKH